MTNEPQKINDELNQVTGGCGQAESRTASNPNTSPGHQPQQQPGENLVEAPDVSAGARSPQDTSSGGTTTPGPYTGPAKQLELPGGMPEPGDVGSIGGGNSSG